jgi:hypothetical protein
MFRCCFKKIGWPGEGRRQTDGVSVVRLVGHGHGHGRADSPINLRAPIRRRGGQCPREVQGNSSSALSWTFVEKSCTISRFMPLIFLSNLCLPLAPRTTPWT